MLKEVRVGPTLVKYAEASAIDITFGGQEVLSLIIIDDGQGFDQDKVVLGMGLSGIRDRVNMLQGSVTISSRPGKGTSIHVEFPRVTLETGRDPRYVTMQEINKLRAPNQ